jgi:iron-sulfur cluster assembly accessory protein
MLNEIQIKTISISEEAAQVVKNIIAERKLDGYALRVFVSAGGCCGAQFGMALDNNTSEVDIVIETNGIRLMVDKTSLEYLHGASIEFVHDPQKGDGFIVNNPNQQSCGCDEGGSTCGGSCSCNN